MGMFKSTTLVGGAVALMLTSTGAFGGQYEDGAQIGPMPTAYQTQFAKNQMRIRTAGGYRHEGAGYRTIKERLAFIGVLRGSSESVPAYHTAESEPTYKNSGSIVELREPK